jgi:transcriptional regulator with XRE-family HTH domain
MNDMEFYDILYQARERLGLRLYKAAEHCEMTMGRLKRLESGMFRSTPDPSEVQRLCELYDLPFNQMWDKAEHHVNKFKRPLKAQEFLDG